MSWDERLFGRLFSALRRRGARIADERGCLVEPERARLELVASALAGRRMELAIAEGAGGLSGDLIIVPSRLGALGSSADNATLLLVRIALAATIARHRIPVSPDATVAALETFAWLGRARAELVDELPGAATMLAHVMPLLHERRPKLASLAGAHQAMEAAAQVALGAEVAAIAKLLPTSASIWLGELATGTVSADAGKAVAGARVAPLPLLGWLRPAGASAGSIEAPDPSQRAGRGGRERKGRVADVVRRRKLDESPVGESPLMHSFEKVETLEKYKGGRKSVDGADELDAHGDALDELELDEVVRSASSTAGVYKADLVGLDGAGEVAEPEATVVDTLAYDEWDEGNRRYRAGWCQVRVDRTPAVASPEVVARFVRTARARYHRERAELAMQIARLDAQPLRVGRQQDGADIDVDAVVERHGALQHGSTGPDKLYVALRRRPPDLAVTMLLDRSLSSDAWVADQRVLDVGAAALVALGDALGRARARTSLLAFSSHTRRDCRLEVIKPFDTTWAAAHARLAALEPSGYTRIGPALRHATSELRREPARRKLLVLLSDGKPTDYDRYEGRYGIADVRRAVAEAAVEGVFVFAVALDQRAQHHLPQMFGSGGFAVVSRPRDLVAALGRLYQQRLAT